MSLWNLQMQQAATQRVRDRELDIYYEEQRVKATPSEIIIRRARFNWRSYRWVFLLKLEDCLKIERKKKHLWRKVADKPPGEVPQEKIEAARREFALMCKCRGEAAGYDFVEEQFKEVVEELREYGVKYPWIEQILKELPTDVGV